MTFTFNTLKEGLKRSTVALGEFAHGGENKKPLNSINSRKRTELELSTHSF